MVKALYPGSFDPVTNGHVDIVNRSSRLFKELVVAVYDAPPKKLLFTTEERVDLVRRAVSHLHNVSVTTYKGLTVELAKQLGASVMVRGLRMGADFEYEFEMALMNKKLGPDIEVVCLMSSLEYQFLSSSLLKEAAQLGGNVNGLVPDHVAKALLAKLQAVRAQ